MNAKLKQFATYHWTNASQSVIIKNGPGTLHAVFRGLHPTAGEARTADSGLTYTLFDNSATAAGTLIMCQYACPLVNPTAPQDDFFNLDVDFTQGLAIQLNAGAATVGAVTVVFS